MSHLTLQRGTQSCYTWVPSTSSPDYALWPAEMAARIPIPDSARTIGQPSVTTVEQNRRYTIAELRP